MSASITFVAKHAPADVAGESEIDKIKAKMRMDVAIATLESMFQYVSSRCESPTLFVEAGKTLVKISGTTTDGGLQQNVVFIVEEADRIRRNGQRWDASEVKLDTSKT
jgi:hypothetical protein